VAQLRARKQRPAKPFAVMALNVASVAQVCEVGANANELLESRERPIVLLDAVASVDQLLPGVAPGLDQLGVMLPLTPIQWLLWHEAAGRPQGSEWADAPSSMLLVMTSANPGGEPLVRDNDEALARLGHIADAILDHDRDIVARCDDSVIALHGAQSVFLRRSRGYAPQAISLGEEGATVLALGAHMKTTVCATRGAEAFLSPHVGDLDTAAGCAFLDETAQRLLDLLAVRPERIAHDAHPDLYSSRLAQRLAAQFDVPTLAVQHHHAHIAAVCAEHQWCEPVLGLALDGIGYGADGGVWGGELLQVAGAQFERIGHLRPLPLPGGDRAAREPWRMAAAVLHALGRGDEIARRFSKEAGAATVATMLERGLNSPPTSSLGRVFDAATALLGLCAHQRFEAQAAILLEQAAQRYIRHQGWLQPRVEDAAECATLDLLPLLDRLVEAQDAERSAAEFHAGLVTTLGAWVAAAAQRSGLNTVALGGGCFANRLLMTGLRQNLEQRGLQVLQPRLVPPGDGGLALGQAWVALNKRDN
jgi:hydrogenase maturation protein HypF